MVVMMANGKGGRAKRKMQTQQSNRGSSGRDERKEVNNVVQKGLVS
jgi:hypothetical protein